MPPAGSRGSLQGRLSLARRGLAQAVCVDFARCLFDAGISLGACDRGLRTAFFCVFLFFAKFVFLFSFAHLYDEKISTLDQIFLETKILFALLIFGVSWHMFHILQSTGFQH